MNCARSLVVDPGLTRRARCGAWWGVILVLLLSVTPGRAAAAASPTDGPTEAVRATIGELRGILKRLQDPSRSDMRRVEIESVVRQHVHYESMAQRSLGGVWASLNEGERIEYVGLFVQMMRDALANRMMEDSGEPLVFLSEERDGAFAEVKTRLVGGKVDTLIDFRLTNRAGAWLAYDVVVDGASLVGSYRAQFARIIRESSYDRLLDQLKQKTLVVKSFEKGGF